MWKFKKVSAIDKLESDLFGCCRPQFHFGSFQLLDERILISEARWRSFQWKIYFT